MSYDQILMLPPGYGFDSAAWTPASLSSLTAWFDPSYGVYSDAGTTPAVVGDPVYRWVSRNSASLYAEQATLAARPILRQGANGFYYLEFDGSNDLMTVTQALAVGTFAIGVQRRSGDGDYGRFVGTQTPNDVFVYAGSFDLGANTTVVYVRNEDGSDQVTLTLAAGSVFDWQTYSATYSGNGQTNRARKRGESDSTVAGATPAANSVWSIGAGGAVFGKVNVSDLVRYSDAKSTSDRALVEDFIYARTPT